mmetsp:Transcript_70958/g.205692  ORF Transcript_70958/g.205692 Transcript_70958/m.205692 type:complete len:1274 (+) Transcript_70958:83-3904(+)
MIKVARLAARARRQGELRDADCEALPELSAPIGQVAEAAEIVWHETRRANGARARVAHVAFAAVRWPLARAAISLTLRGCGNAFVLPLLLAAVVNAVEVGDVSAAWRSLGLLLAERVVGALLEYDGFKCASTEVPMQSVMAVASVIVEKASSPGILGLQEAGVDPVALVGRELTVLHGKMSQMLPNGLIAFPTLIAGSISLFFLLGWSAIFGVVWLAFTIRIGVGVLERAKVAEGQMSTIATERLGVLTNIVSAIKAIKYFAWEPEFLEVLREKRSVECVKLQKRARFTVMAIAIGKVTPVTGSLATFVAYALLGNPIKASTIFAANSVFMTLRFSVGAVSFLSELWKSTALTFARADKFLLLEERPPREVLTGIDSHLAEVKDLRVSFPRQLSSGESDGGVGGFALVVNGQVELGRRGTLTAVCGAVGSGKSTFLSALVGEFAGEASVRGHARTIADVGWAPQKPFVISGTFEENILLGRAVDEYKLGRCLADACLAQDLEQLEGGLEELVGERGTTLSGGQQTRLGLARALYGNPSLLLLDDPLAAVDAKTGRALLSALRRRCEGAQLDWSSERASPVGAIVVLNQLQLLPSFDQIVFIKDGVVSAVGSFNGLRKNPDFAAFLNEIGTQERHQDTEMDNKARQLEIETIEKTVSASRLRQKSGSLSAKLASRKEVVASGFVRWAVWRSYLFAPGRGFFAGILALYVVMYVTLGLRDWWMSVWADEDGANGAYYIGIFVAFGLSHVAVVAFTVWVIGAFAAQAGRRLHSDCADRLMHAPMSYFDSTPSGRIASRLGPDLAMVDSTMASGIDVTLTFTFMVVTVCTTVVTQIPLMAIVFAAAFVVTVPVFYGLAIFRQDTRRHSNHAMAPVLSNLSELRRGAALLNAMRCKDFFISRHRESTAQWSRFANACMFTTPIAQSWCHFLHLFVLVGTGLMTFSQADELAQNPGLVAMYFSYAALWGLFAMVTMGSTMNMLQLGASLERLVEYSIGDFPQEAAWALSNDPPPKAWPCKGAVEFQSVSLRYREGLPLALENFDLRIAGGEKIGIVGRTGAGKSTLTCILFRLVDCEAGRVTIDGVDIAGIGLHTLRKSISMIPQEPIVMNGTVRYNLDPFGAHKDERLQAALETAGLVPAVTLDSLASGIGSGLSAGQKQLLTFARTLLQDTRIVTMDEPTSSVDMQTDRLVQRMSQKAFESRTVLTIAHRLDTVRHCDRLVVLERGRLAEVGPPAELLADPNSRLSRLTAAAEGGAAAAKVTPAMGRLAMQICRPCE